MAVPGQINPPNYPPYPDNDKERIDLIFQAYEKEALTMWISVAEITPSMGWNLQMNELQRLEKLLVKTRFFNKTPKGYYHALQLKDDARDHLDEHILYSKYLESLQPKESDEDKILKYLKSKLPNIWTSASNVFDDCNIDKANIGDILFSLGTKILIKNFIGTEDCIISITDEGKNYLRNPPQYSQQPAITKTEHHEYHAPVTTTFINDVSGLVVNDSTIQESHLSKTFSESVSPSLQDKSISQKIISWIVSNIWIVILGVSGSLIATYLAYKYHWFK